MSDAFQVSQEDLAGAMRERRAPEASAVRRMCGGAAPDHLGNSPGHQNLSADENEVLVDDITAPLKGRNKELVVMARKVIMKLTEEVEEKGLNLSITENGEERAR